MQIINDSIIQPIDLLSLGFKELRDKTLEEVTMLMFEDDASSVVLTDFNGEKHIFFIEHESKQLKYYRPFNVTLDGILFTRA